MISPTRTIYNSAYCFLHCSKHLNHARYPLLPPPTHRTVPQLHRMVDTVDDALDLDGSAEHSTEHITAAFGGSTTTDVAVTVATQAAQSGGLSTGMVCGGALVIAVAGVAYGAVRNLSKISCERAAEAQRANEKARACQELLELTQAELVGLYAKYRRQRRALVGLRELHKSKEDEVHYDRKSDRLEDHTSWASRKTVLKLALSVLAHFFDL